MNNLVPFSTFMILYTYHLYLVLKYILYFKTKPPSPVQFFPIVSSFQLRAPTSLRSVPVVCILRTCHINRIIQYVPCSGWFLSLSAMFLKFPHCSTCISTSFPSVAEYYSIVGIDHNLFMYQSTDGYLGFSPIFSYCS